MCVTVQKYHFSPSVLQLFLLISCTLSYCFAHLRSDVKFFDNFQGFTVELPVKTKMKASQDKDTLKEFAVAKSGRQAMNIYPTSATARQL